MADSDSDLDEFPDPFVGVDWNTVPGLSDAVLTVSANPDRSRNALASTDSLGSILGEDALEGAATPSSHYSFDDLDDSAFAELDALEGGLTVESGSGSGSLSMAGSSRFRAVEGTHVGKAQSDVERISTTNNSIKSSPVQRVSRYFSAQAGEHDSESPVRPRATTGAAITPGKLSTPRKRQKMYLDSPKTTPIKSTKGKEKESPNTGLRRVLSGFEDEMTCPICCDLLAAVHVGNPCGHSFCSECGWGWIGQNRKKAATCPVCRSHLSAEVPMISNIAMDNTIEKHVQALRESGVDGWEVGGSQLSDWQKRKEKGKALAAKRASAAPPRKPRTTIASDMFEVIYELLGDDPLDVDFVDDGSELGEGEEDPDGDAILPQTIRNAAYNGGNSRGNPRRNRSRGHEGAGGSRRSGGGGGQGYHGSGGPRGGGRGANRSSRGHGERRR